MELHITEQQTLLKNKREQTWENKGRQDKEVKRGQAWESKRRQDIEMKRRQDWKRERRQNNDYKIVDRLL